MSSSGNPVFTIEDASQNFEVSDAAKPTTLDKANQYAGKALSAAGLPTSIKDIPNWFEHFVGVAKDSKPFWDAFKTAVENPTQENIVAAVPFFGPASVAMSKDVQKGDYGGAAATLAGTIGSLAAPGQIKPGLEARVALKNTTAGIAPSSTLAERMYQSALKPSTKMPLEKVQGAVKTGLEEGIAVSPEGAEKLSGLIDDLNTKIQAKIDAGTAQGATINKYAVASRLKQTYGDVSSQVNPEKAQAAVGKSGNEFLRNQPSEIPASQAQAIKQGTYQQIRKSYGQLSDAAKESQKALARGLKEELVQQFPEIGQLNAKESQLINLDGALEQALKRISNHQLVGIGTPMVAAGAGAITKSTKVGAAAGIIKAVLDDPILKSKIAIALNKKGVPIVGAKTRIAAYANAVANAQPSGGQTSEQGNE